MNKIDPKTLTIKEASKLLQRGEVSAVELAETYLEQIEKSNQHLNAFLTVSKNQAMEQAEDVDKLISQKAKLSPLAGMPIGLKDLFSTSGIRTSAGSKVLESYVPVYDSTVVTKLKNQHTIFLGKTNQDAWGHGASGENSDYGPAKNPYDLERVPGGSSSGSAAAVASGMCIAATSTDTGGSTRQPAGFCNLVGLKPTYGRVSRYGVIAMASSLDTIGHMTKTVYDSALILNATAGHDELDATTSLSAPDDYTKEIEKGVKDLKIGLPKEYIENLEPKIKTLILEALKKLENLGAKILEVSLPHTEYGVATYYIIQPSEVSSNLARYDGIRFGNKRESFGAEAKRRIILGTYTLSSGYYDAYYLKAMKVRRLIRKDFTDVFSKVDALICPISPSTPFKIGEKSADLLQMYLADIYTVNPSLAGIPSLAVPSGFSEDLPVGMQIIGPDFSEKLLYQIGFAYEQETKWYEREPNI